MADPKKILIVDDEPTILLSLSYCLKSAGLESVTASHFEEARQALLRERFGLVITDVRMSGIQGRHGLELLSFVKAGWPDTAVIVMTAYGSDEMRDEAIDRGASFYFEKPVDIGLLLATVGGLGIMADAGRAGDDNAGLMFGTNRADFIEKMKKYRLL